MTPDLHENRPQLDNERLEHMGAQTVDCDVCNKTGIPLYEFWDDHVPLCEACLIKLWQEWLPNEEDE